MKLAYDLDTTLIVSNKTEEKIVIDFLFLFQYLATEQQSCFDQYHRRRGFSSKELELVGGSHSSVVLSAPTIMRPQVQTPSTPSLLF